MNGFGGHYFIWFANFIWNNDLSGCNVYRSSFHFKKACLKKLVNILDKRKQNIEDQIKKTEQYNLVNDNDYPIVDVTVEGVRKAIRAFSDNLPKGVYRTILVQEDNRIDFKQLAPLLGGIPSRKFYMSKETYDLFEESEKQIPLEMDIVQKAVDLYVKEHKEFPMLKFDPQHKVNYFQLKQEHYLKEEPKIQFYITDLDGLITHIKPQKKKMENTSHS
ncbi:DUF3939 domain-containing protein [Neobacillus sp. BF23-41]|uniref:DUF3939 domain-containing protein n=1 Tax=Neobacillus sp. BF23-41 TaxID=3240280 RepID=UPI0034E588EA